MSDYVTAIAWTPDNSRLAACSACGEVVLYDGKTGTPTVLQAAQGQSLDALSISHNGQFLATGGQAGILSIWEIQGQSPRLLAQLEHSRLWLDCLEWNPHHAELAFGLGRYVQVWDGLTQTVATTVHFEASSVLDLAWHPQGEYLAVSGNQSLKIWQRQQWDEDPQVLATGGASVAIAWATDGSYLASGNNDCSLLVWDRGCSDPWRMSGFSGKVRQIAWSTPTPKSKTPLIAAISGEDIVTWTKSTDPDIGWTAQILDSHEDKVTAIAFQPNSQLLASASEDNRIYLWHKAQQIAQILKGSSQGFSSLAWNSSGTALAAGGHQGEIFVWTESTQGKGFGSS